ncbi:MAG: hypothetical protein CFE45_41700, partial [Burkholderiales bacterium PBB5]
RLGIDIVTAVPEPASVVMLALGLASLAARARLRARRADPSVAGACGPAV